MPALTETSQKSDIIAIDTSSIYAIGSEQSMTTIGAQTKGAHREGR